MSKIDKYNAPEGYTAVEPERYHHFGGECKGCCFLGNYECLSEEAICSAECREDGRDVIFKPGYTDYTAISCHVKGPRSDDLCSR